MSNPRLTLEFGSIGEKFIVDRYMGVYYVPYEGADDSYNFHVSELNHGQYERLWKGLVGYQIDNHGFSTTMPWDEFKCYMERCFEMYDILRKIPS